MREATCRHCKESFHAPHADARLCHECQFMQRTYANYDSLREEGYTIYQAKVMSGLADPEGYDND